MRRLAALAAVALLAGCAEEPAQHAARLAVERVSEQAGRDGETKCTPSARLFFAQGEKASVFICLVKIGGGVCDRYVVKQGAVSLQRREADCILPAT